MIDKTALHIAIRILLLLATVHAARALPRAFAEIVLWALHPSRGDHWTRRALALGGALVLMAIELGPVLLYFGEGLLDISSPQGPVA